jgi:hypothetical protein
VWLSLADNHIKSIQIDWEKTKRFCFNERSNPDDNKLGIQIVKVRQGNKMPSTAWWNDWVPWFFTVMSCFKTSTAGVSVVYSYVNWPVDDAFTIVKFLQAYVLLIPFSF